MRSDTVTDVTAILHPLPVAPATADVDELDAYDAARQQADDDRRRTADQLWTGWEHASVDPLLAALASARRARERAEAQIRHLVAYGREFVQPRPYTLADLAEASGMSVSGVRTGYDHHDVDAVAEATGARPRDWRATDRTDNDAIRELLNDFARRHKGDSARPSQVYLTLQHEGWTPHAPEGRTPGTKATKRYIRWERTWPGGTTVTLYQDVKQLSASNKIAEDDPRRFHVDYTHTDPHDVWAQLAQFTARIEELDAARTAQATVPMNNAQGHPSLRPGENGTGKTTIAGHVAGLRTQLKGDGRR
ncbi:MULTISPECIES: hypothetical protein [Micromonospora]|uniref:hypothetical protein n=1 Tax=Micromonospora TaxID=1873 RepID=UPI0007C87755|nr:MULTISPECIES: hypothetical protein [unclassified Micromonospora]MDG4756197.1 hypothetical protein [Micromonospora sp. WMMD718]